MKKIEVAHMRHFWCLLATIPHSFGRTFLRLIVLILLSCGPSAASADDAVKKSFNKAAVHPAAPRVAQSDSTAIETQRSLQRERANTAGPKANQATDPTLKPILILGFVSAITSFSVLTVAGVILWWSRKAHLQLNHLDTRCEKLVNELNTTDGHISELKTPVQSILEKLSSIQDNIPTLEKIGSEIHKSFTQISDVSSDEGQVSKQREGLAARKSDLDNREESLNEREASLNQREFRLKNDEDSFMKKTAELKDDKNSFDSMKKTWVREQEELRNELMRKTNEAKAEIENAASSMKKAIDIQTEAQKERQNASEQIKQAVERAEKAAKTLEEVKDIRKYFWPEAFCDGGTLFDWRDRLEKKGTMPRSAAPLLIHSLQHYKLLKSLVSGGDVNPDGMERAIQEVGRWAYAVWSEENLDDDTKANTAEDWAKAIQADLGPKYKLRVARLGESKDSSWMSYKLGGPSQVTRVETWYVQGPNSTLKAVVG